MNLVFFGSAPFSVLVLKKLIDQNLVNLVVTTKDKPVGRHLKLTPNPVKVLAQKTNIPVVDSLHDSSFIIPNSIGLVAAYGRILKPEILDKFNGRLYNIHPSLLPKYRGPSPLQTQILDGVTDTGVSIITLDEQMDHGPIVTQQKDVILDSDTFQTLGERLFTKGAELFIDVILNRSEGSRLDSSAQPQNDAEATYTKMLTRQDGFIPYEIFNDLLTTHNPQLKTKFRAYYPWPGVWTTTPEGKRLKLITLKPEILIQLEGRSIERLANTNLAV